MTRAPFAIVPILLALALVRLGTAEAQQASDDGKDRRPKLALRATPAISFSPARVNFTAELRGGSDGYEEYYCPSIEWEWGDGMQSESTQDCEPYEPGKSAIKRFYTASHVFDLSGRYTVVFKLKRDKKVLTTVNTVVQVRPGVRDMYPD